MIIAHKPDYYRLLREVIENGAWEAWLLFMLAGVAETATWTQAQIAAIRVIVSNHRLYSSAGKLVLEQNAFLEIVLTSSILRTLGDAEKNAYGRPYLEPGEARRPLLSWPREVPIGGEPKDVVQIVQAYADWLASSDLPKLFINAEPGSLVTEERREFCRTWPNQTEVTVRGIHFIQEDSPDEIGQAIAEWRAGL